MSGTDDDIKKVICGVINEKFKCWCSKKYCSAVEVLSEMMVSASKSNYNGKVPGS